MFLILSVVTMLTVLTTIVLRTISFNTDLALQRQWYEQKIAATEGIMHCGIGLCKQQFYQLVVTTKKGEPYIIFPVGDWRVGNQSACGKLIIENTDNQLLLTALLLDENKTICKISCAVQAVADNEEYEGEEKQKLFKVSAWKLYESS